MATTEAPEVESNFDQQGDSKKRRRDPIEDHERRTIYVLNLPNDVTHRELQNMFFFWPGFLKCSLYTKDGKTNAFALFDTPTYALDARNRLDGYIFDEASGSGVTLVTKMAMKNLVLTREEAAKMQGLGRGYVQQPGPGYPQPPPRGAPQMPYGAPPAHMDYGAPSNPYAAYPQMPQQPFVPQPASNFGAPRGFGAPRASRTVATPNPPCATLFLAKIEAITDADLLSLLEHSCAGYKAHKFSVDRSGQRVGFVEFNSVESATSNMHFLTSQGIQAAYARNELNRRS